jgi:hypothetical protein
MLRLRSLALIGAAATGSLLSCVLVASAPASAATPGQFAHARVQVRPGGSAAPSEIGTNHSLNSDSCPDAAFCMAVGDYDLGSRVPGLSEVLSAGSWVVKHVPAPSRGGNVFANEVSCSSAAKCLFVGAHWAGRKGDDANLAEAWNGTAWRIITTSRPAGTTYSGLNGVACPTPGFCLVVGNGGTTSHRYRDTAYTWRDGTTWRQVSVPQPAGARSSELASVACSDAASCLAVGNYTSAAGRLLPFAARWHSGHWKILAVPAVEGQRYTFPEGISCPAATKCIAVGYTEDKTKGEYYHAFAEAWSAGKWHVSPVRRLPSLFLGVSCPAASRCFASGYTFPSKRSYAHQLIETWNGRAWTTQRPAQTAGLGGNLPQVSCVSAVLCETVGYAFNPGVAKSDEAISEVWDGHKWVGQVTPNP